MLDKEEIARLNRSLGRWPAFPVTVDELARKHGLKFPWQTMPPGSRERRWEVYRPLPRTAADELPPLSRHELRTFALLELSPKDRADLGLLDQDVGMWKRLQQEYFKRNPQELDRLRRAEKKGKAEKGKKDLQP